MPPPARRARTLAAYSACASPTGTARAGSGEIHSGSLVIAGCGYESWGNPPNPPSGDNDMEIVRMGPQGSTLFVTSPNGGEVLTTGVTTLSVVLNPHFTGSLSYDCGDHCRGGAFGVALCEGMGRLERLRTLASLGKGRFTGLPKTRFWEAAAWSPFEHYLGGVLYPPGWHHLHLWLAAAVVAVNVAAYAWAFRGPRRRSGRGT